MPFSYDTVEYETMMYAQTHIERLAFMAKLYGFSPTETGQCRVLEVGCGDGWNLMPMALRFPDSQFFGLDLSKTMIDVGQKRIEKHGISNLTLAHLDLMNLPEHWTDFDYIIAHGFYSWVPPFVREKLMEVCRDRLTENGVAYISYKTYPGAYFFQMTREMMQFHADSQGFTELLPRVEQGRAILDLTKNAMPVLDDAMFQNRYVKYLEDEVHLLNTLPDFYLLHDILADFSQPFYFLDFMKTAAEYRLQFVAEADFAVMQSSRLSSLAKKLLHSQEDRPLIREQYIDYFIGRSLRTTLLTRNTQPRNNAPNHEALYYCHFVAPLQIEKSTENVDEVILTWKNRNTIKTSHVLMKRLASILAQLFPESIAFDQLYQFMQPLLMRDLKLKENEIAQRALLAQLLLNLYAEALVEVQTSPFSQTRMLSEKPKALRIAQICVMEKRPQLINAFHEDVVCENETARKSLTFLDGTKTISALIQYLNVGETLVQDALEWLLKNGMIEA